MKKLLLMLCAVAFVGCVPPMNYVRSALRAGGDLAATARLEYVELDEVGGERAGVKAVAEKLLAFLDTGAVADLPLDGLARELKKKVPAKYAYVVDMAFAQAVSLSVDTSKLGVRNVKRLRAFLRGVVVGCDRYDVADRPKKDD